MPAEKELCILITLKEWDIANLSRELKSSTSYDAEKWKTAFDARMSEVMMKWWNDEIMTHIQVTLEGQRLGKNIMVLRLR